MQPFEKIKKYRDTVCEQIRWKKAKPMIATEIENHLCDQRDAYITDGDNEKIATDKAILQMGDAVSIGLELDKTHKPKPQWTMITLTGILMSIGILVNYIIDTSEYSLNTFSILPFLLAFGLFILCYYLDFTILGKYAMAIYFATLGFSSMGILLGTGINGSFIWILGHFSVSLSYLALTFPLVFALFVYKQRKKGYHGILLSGIGFLPLAALLVIIPTTTGLILYTLSALTILCFAIWKGWFGVNRKQGLLLVLIPTLVIFVLVVVFITQKASDRLSTFLNPYEDRLGAGYLLSLIRDFLSESVFIGKGGIPHNVTGIVSLPNISTDYSLVYLIHQYGFVVLFAVTAFIISFAIIAIYKAMKQKSALGSIIALSIVLTFILQSILYIVDNLGYGLVSSLSLPFISYGNSALFINAALIGFMLSVFRTGDICNDNIASSKNNNPVFSYKDGKLTVDFKGGKI